MATHHHHHHPPPPKIKQQEFQVYKKLRVERMNARMEGTRKKRAEEEAAAEKDKA